LIEPKQGEIMAVMGKMEVPFRKLLPGVKNIIAVASGKGGVGKSTVSANLALALSRSGVKVGLMDADVYGPSIPTILGITEKPAMTADNRVAPVERYGVKVISTGFFVPQHEAVIWRGPMLHKMIQDLLGVVDWGELDYLLIDLPPGTGDVQLSLCQSIPLTGAVIVSTPQDVAWNVAQKAIVMFDKLNAPILGIVENMSHHICSHCGGREEIFGTGGARRAAERLEIPYLGEIPLVTSLRQTADEGDPVVHSAPASAEAKMFVGLAERLVAQVGIRNAKGAVKPVPAKIGAPGPEFSIEWSDGLKTVFTARDLRLACPCAACVDEVSGQRTLRPEYVAQDVIALSVHPVGRYALQIMWSDGHNTGLYGFEYLRKLARS
jgi:ATP-binding protein involved in chromosome partitioning